LQIYIDEITYTRVNFKGFVNRNLSEDYNQSSSTFQPHKHGGYIIQITYNKTPQCLIDTTNGCSQSYIFIKVTELYILKGNCQTGNDGVSSNVFYCQIIAPTQDNNYLSYFIGLSWDYGITYSDNAHSAPITQGTLCSAGYYCPAYKIVSVDKGYFCDFIPNSVFDLYCKYQRKCMPGKF
jgi:hypothetical protein